MFESILRIQFESALVIVRYGSGVAIVLGISGSRWLEANSLVPFACLL